MGGMFSTKTKYLSKDEIDKISSTNPTLERLYDRYKNYEGYISFKEFSYLLGNKVENMIKKKLFKIFTVNNNNAKFNYDLLKNFYSIFYNNINDNAKTIFLADLIFSKKQAIKLSKYVERIVLMFKKADNIQKMFLDKQFYSKFQSKENNLLQKDGFIALLNTSVLSNFIRQFNFINYADTNKKYLKQLCNCYKIKNIQQDTINNKKQSSSSINGKIKDINKPIEDYLNIMEEEYKKVEIRNDGLFTIQMFERMLNEVDCDKRLSNALLNYIKRKTEKVNIHLL